MSPQSRQSRWRARRITLQRELGLCGEKCCRADAYVDAKGKEYFYCRPHLLEHAARQARYRDRKKTVA